MIGPYIDFRNFFIPYVFEVNESISCSFTKLICSSDLENPGKLPVLQVLKDTDNWVLRIFKISSFPTFSRSMNPFLAVLQSYNDRVTSQIQLNFRFYRSSMVLMIVSCRFSKFLSFLTFFEVEESIFRGYPKLLCSGNLKNPDQLSVSQVLKGTDDWVLRILDISLFPTFSSSRNPFHKSYNVR